MRNELYMVDLFLPTHIMSSAWISWGDWKGWSFCMSCTLSIGLSIQYWVNASFSPKFICKSFTATATLRHVVWTCSSTFQRVSFDEQESPGYYMATMLVKLTELDRTGPTENKVWNPTSVSQTFCVLPIFHLQQGWCQLPPIWPDVSLWEGLSPGAKLQYIFNLV